MKKVLFLGLILCLLSFQTARAESGWQGDHAVDIKTDTLHFDKNLTSADDTVQAALETLDELSTSSISDTAYAASWDGVTTVAPSKNAVYDVISGLAGGHNAVTLATDADTLLGLSTQQLTLDTQTANYVFAGPTNGAAADPTFRALVDADIPDTITITTNANFSGDVTSVGNATDITESVLAVGGTDTIFPADPNADRFLMWDDDPGALVWSSSAGGEASTVGDTATIDLTLTGVNITADAILAKDIVAGVGLSGGEDNVLPGADADTTLTFDSTELEALTWGAGGNASNIWTFNLSGTDVTVTFGSDLITFSSSLTLVTGKNFKIGTTQWNSGDSIDGTKIANADLGDIGVSSGVWAVEDDSHAHTASTITEADPLSATKALGNLASVAINTSLISDTANTDDLGTEAIFWKKLYLTSDISFEGATDDAYQTTLTAVDTTLSDKSINIPNASGTLAVSATAPATLSALGDVGVTVLKDLVTTAPLTGGTNDILVGADSDITIAIPAAATGADGYLTSTDWNTFNGKMAGTLAKDLVTTAPLTGGTDDILPGADSDVTLAITVSKDIVAGVGLSGGEDNVLPGADADTTLTFAPAELEGVTWGGGAAATIVHTFDVSGTDTTMTMGSALTTFSGDVTATGDLTATGSDVTIGAAGVKLTGDDDGAITFLGLGDGSDENLLINFDDTANEVDITSGTGVLDIDFNTIDLNTDTLELTGTGTINGIDVIDATSETTLEATLDIAGEVTSTGMGSTVIADSVAVTSWALTTPTVTTSIAFNADPAEAGAIRLSNADYIYSEAAPAGADISVIGVDATEIVQIAASGAGGVTITPTVTITGDLNVNGDDIQLGATGVKITDDTDGAITFLGSSAGADEDLRINLDDTANVVVMDSSTSATELDWLGTSGSGALFGLGSTGVLIQDDADGAISFTGRSAGSDENLTINLDDTADEAVVSSSTSANLSLGLNLLVNENGIVLDSAISADGKYSGITEAGTAGATLAFGDLVYLAVADSRWELADANLSATYDKKLGICVLAAAGDASATTILLWGKVNAATAFPTLTIGAPVYMSETAGDVAVAAPTTTDSATRILGTANTGDELFFNPSNNYYTHT